jgi:hypothetical protein
MKATNEKGEAVEWELQMGSTITTGRQGWTRDTLLEGDRITVELHRAMNGKPYGVVESVEKDGTRLATTAFYWPAVTAKTATLQGKWMANPAELVNYPGGFWFFSGQSETERKRLRGPSRVRSAVAGESRSHAHRASDASATRFHQPLPDRDYLQ